MSALKSTEFVIPKVKDSILLGALSALCKAGPANKVQFQFCAGGEHLDLNPDDLLTYPTIANLTTFDSHSFDVVIVYFNNGSQAEIRPAVAKNQPQIFMNVSVNPGTERDRDRFIHIVGQSKRILGELSVDGSVRTAIASAEKDHAEIRELFLRRQEEYITAQSERLDSYFLKLTDEFNVQRLKLEDEYKAKREESDKQHQAKIHSLDERETAFKDEVAKFNLQRSKGERRNALTELLSQLDSGKENFKFQLTSPTTRMRWPVMGLTAALAGVLLGLAIYFANVESNYVKTATDETATVWHVLRWIRPTAFSLGAVITFACFIRWMNQWAENHAKEEFRLKRMFLEVQRAKVLIETALEWQEDVKEPMPPELLDALSRDLFKDHDSHESVPPVETLASILGASAQLRLKGAGFEALLNRRDVAKLNKPPKDTHD